MKHLSKTLLASALAMALVPVAHAELSANIGATSNYVWRGATQTDDGPAISGGIDYAHESGFYAGTWASNVEPINSGDKGTEVDLYAGFAGEYQDFGYDIGLFYYMYPNYDDFDFLEIGVSGSYKWVSVGLNYTINGDAPDDAMFSDGDIYYYASVEAPLDDDWSVGAVIGYYDFDDAADTEYLHYGLSVTRGAGDFGDFTFGVSMADEEANAGDDDPRVYVGWAKSF